MMDATLLRKRIIEKHIVNETARAKVLNKRQHVRHDWTKFDGQVIKPDAHKSIAIKPIDLSESGICFESAEELEVGETVLVIYKKRAIRLIVMWVALPESETGLPKYGLQRKDDITNLCDLLA